MLPRKYLFPHVIEMNYQAGRRLGVNVYLIDGGSEFLLIDVGYLETVDEIVDLIRRWTSTCPPARCSSPPMPTPTTSRGSPAPRKLLKTKVAAHPPASSRSRRGDAIMTYATIKAQDIDIPMPPCKIDVSLNEGDMIKVGDVKLEGLAHAGPHGRATQLQDGQPALLRRQHLQGQLRRRHRRPPRLEHSRLHQVAQAHPRATTPSFCCPATARSSAATTASSRRRSTG